MIRYKQCTLASMMIMELSSSCALLLYPWVCHNDWLCLLCAVCLDGGICDSNSDTSHLGCDCSSSHSQYKSMLPIPAAYKVMLWKSVHLHHWQQFCRSLGDYTPWSLTIVRRGVGKYLSFGTTRATREIQMIYTGHHAIKWANNNLNHDDQSQPSAILQSGTDRVQARDWCAPRLYFNSCLEPSTHVPFFYICQAINKKPFRAKDEC